MTNKENNKLDNKIKDALKDYEAPYNPGHWAEMETLLGAKPVVNPFKKFGFSLNTFIGVAAIGAASYVAYYLVSKPGNRAAITEEKNAPAVVLPGEKNKNTSPSINATFTVESATAENQNANLLPVANALYPNGNLNNPTALNETKATANNGLVRGNQASHNYSKTAQEMTGKSDVDFLLQNFMKNNDTLYHAETIFFGDMIDPKKGIVYSTQEKDKLKKVAQEEYNIGGNTFVVYPDEEKNKKENATDSEIVMSSDDNKADKSSDSKSQRPKKEKRKKTPKTDEVNVSADNGSSEIKEMKNDSIKKRKDKAKYNEKKDPSDPYDN